jgi:hypothetical protein
MRHGFPVLRVVLWSLHQQTSFAGHNQDKSDRLFGIVHSLVALHRTIIVSVTLEQQGKTGGDLDASLQTQDASFACWYSDHYFFQAAIAA